MHKITESRLRRIILEEIASMEVSDAQGKDAKKSELSSDLLKQKSDALGAASALMKAIETFEEKCPPACKAFLEVHLKTLKDMLLDIESSTEEYINPTQRRGLKGEPTGLIAHGEEEEDTDE